MHTMSNRPTHKTGKLAKFGISTALAAVLLSGCAGTGSPRANLSTADAQKALAASEMSEAVIHAEAAVAADPNNGAFRVLLGNAYLESGRFASAEMAFDEAMTLGENSPRVALSMALSLAGQAKYAHATTILGDWESAIAPADLGLALALSGQPERGIHIMSNAIRAGENTAKMRQNLAYAYAVAGRWREARLMVQQDVPADQVGDRMAEWASMATSEAYQHRIANLLQVPVTRGDPGRPAHLALSSNPVTADGGAQMAAKAAVPLSGQELAALNAPTVLPAPAVVPAPAPAPASASASADIVQTITQPVLQPVANPAPRYANIAQTAPTPAQRDEQAIRQDAFDAEFAAAFAPSAPIRKTLASPTTETVRAVSETVTRAAPSRKVAANRPAVANASNASESSHLIQLGSFLSERGALRAWDIYKSRYPELEDHQMVITQAMVDGKRRFRVSASGYDRSASRAMCNRVNSASSDGCITWAAARPLPGAIDTGVRLARR